MASQNFNEREFISLYNEVIGYKIDDFEKRKKYMHNFLYIMKSPPAIYYNFDKKLK